MTLPALLLLTSLASLPQGGAFELPPPPPGMRALGEAEKAALLGRANAKPSTFQSQAEAHEGSEEIEEESAELEAMHALEERSIDPIVAPDALLLQSLRRLGVANPVRQRMLDAFDDPVLREDPVLAPLPRIRNLARLDMALLEDRYDIPVEMQPLVAEYIRFFQGPGRRWFRNWMNRSTRYMPMMQEILTQHGLPRDTIYLAMIESGFSLHAYSWAHAAGPWQFISATGKHFGLEQNYWVDERRDPVKATHSAARYLKELHGQTGHWYLAWAGYNTGVGRVRRLMKKKRTHDFWVISEGRGLMKETKHYVPKLIAAALLAKNTEAFGFRPEEFKFEEPMAFDEVQLADPTDLQVIARAAGVSEKAVRDLNPELKRWCTPPASDAAPYLLRLPVGTRDRFLANFERLPRRQRFTYRVHPVRSGETVDAIARRYRAEPRAIRELNKLAGGRALRAGTELVVPIRRKGLTARPTAPPNAIYAARLQEKSGPAKRIASLADYPAALRVGTKVASRMETPSQTKTVSASPPPRPSAASSARPSQNVASSRARPVAAAAARVPATTTTTTTTMAARKIEARSAPSRTIAGASKHAAGTVREELVNGVPRLTYEVAEGDTLWSVAQRFAISLEELRSWNRISERRHSLKTGTLLTVWMPGQPHVTSRSGASLLRQAESGHREAGQRGTRAD